MINLHLLLYIKGMLSKNQRNPQNKALKIRQLNNLENIWRQKVLLKKN